MNKTAIITGGAQGIGRAICKHLLETGHRVVVADVDAEAGQEILKLYEDMSELRFLQTDVSVEADVQNLVGETLEQFGRLDYVVNNAGIGIDKPVTELSLDEWHKVMGVNLSSIFLTTKYAAPHLKKTSGAIVNIASTRALMSEANTEAYSASKGEVVALTHALAVSLGPEIRVNCISPGWIEVGA